MHFLKLWGSRFCVVRTTYNQLPTIEIRDRRRKSCSVLSFGLFEFKQTWTVDSPITMV